MIWTKLRAHDRCPALHSAHCTNTTGLRLVPVFCRFTVEGNDARVAQNHAAYEDKVSQSKWLPNNKTGKKSYLGKANCRDKSSLGTVPLALCQGGREEESM